MDLHDEIRAEHLTEDTFVVGIRGHRIVVDQPKEAGGDDLGPTPTELFVAGLASCAGFYAERYLRRHDLPDEGLCVRASFEMSTDRPPRVAAIDLRVILPASIPSGRVAALERVIAGCTVHNSIRLEPRIGVEVVLPAAAGPQAA
jgi:putative redox protein